MLLSPDLTHHPQCPNMNLTSINKSSVCSVTPVHWRAVKGCLPTVLFNTGVWQLCEAGDELIIRLITACCAFIQYLDLPKSGLKSAWESFWWGERKRWRARQRARQRARRRKAERESETETERDMVLLSHTFPVTPSLGWGTKEDRRERERMSRRHPHCVARHSHPNTHRSTLWIWQQPLGHKRKGNIYLHGKHICFHSVVLILSQLPLFIHYTPTMISPRVS